ncbi:MAG: carboxypeptidase regulatory-like domain-containing protein [Deltaproteobacteria bacterium]|nr:carboxypeptidase regulatory-like domain-containing protein [Deltaproteobacteria bacterium]MBT8464483.1 carboxypeptidase regulatory-like domain-containing protein [Deltaproteobacteria bacterium]NND27863.1 carboxypeptidase regulatory-like domain-containing protein [Myxococcales bacterium]NNK07983.1 carboxypeptidase regulatory-like domain-containing protein [Myxococcales bacterium]NNK41884.1 carboxypeptidase regulatory-like domain-containing protein [Myxococcales bacterium]
MLGQGARPPIVSSQELDIGSATLSGRIYDERGAPLEGATVSLAGSGFWPARSVRSGADGRFHWDHIPAGIYELQFSKGPLTAASVEGLILDPGAKRAFGVQLVPGWTVAGRVIDAQTGRSIADAEITAATGVLGLHTRRTRSDGRGRFELAGVVGEAQSLYVTADGYVSAGPLRQGSSDPSMTVRLERASTVEGRVVDERGVPVEAALVRAFGEGQIRGEDLGAPDSLGVTSGEVPPISAGASGGLAYVRQVETGRDGRFRLSDLRPGPYRLVASHDDFAPTESKLVHLRAEAAQDDIELVLRPGAELSGRVVDERGDALEGIPVELRSGAGGLPRMSVTATDGSFSFRGVRGEVSVTALPFDLPGVRKAVAMGDDDLVTVELAVSSTLYTLRGRVVDERGFGVGGALVSVSSKSAGTPVRRSAKSDPDGTFSVPALPETPFELEAAHPAFSVTQMGSIDSMDDVRVVLSAGVTLLGEVLDDWSNEGLAGVRVRLDGPARLESKTRSDGTFVIRRAATGTYDVSFSHPDYETQTERVVLAPPRYVDQPQELDRVRLQPGGSIEGHVLDAYSEHVPSAEVTWGDPPLWSRGSRSDADGRFVLRGVPAGSVWIWARHPVAGDGSSDSPIVVRPVETSTGNFIRLPASIAE